MEEKIKTVYVLLLALIMAIGFSLQVQAADVDTAQGLLLDETAISGSFDYAMSDFMIAYLTTDGGYPLTPSGQPGPPLCED